MTFRKTLLAASLMLGLGTLNAQAALIAGTSGGANLVYDTVTNTTWAADGNLLASMGQAMGWSNLANAIIAASPVIHDTPNALDGSATSSNPNSGSYTLSVRDFSQYWGGSTWWGAQGFVNYLNSIDYAGSSHWALPGAGANPQAATPRTGTLLGELLTDELGFIPGHGLPTSSLFANLNWAYYWTSTEYASAADYAWAFMDDRDYQFPFVKYGLLQAMLVTSGDLAGVAPVPEPATALLLSLGMAGLATCGRRRKPV